MSDNKKLLLTLFMVVRNSKVLPKGKELGKSDKEITTKTKETIQELLKIIDYDTAEQFYNLDIELPEETGCESCKHYHSLHDVNKIHNYCYYSNCIYCTNMGKKCNYYERGNVPIDKERGV